MTDPVDRVAGPSGRRSALRGLAPGARTQAHAIPRRPETAGPIPLSFAQQRLWFLDQYAPGNPVYNIPCQMRLRGPLDLAALERALGEVVRRHESLRTTFIAADDHPAQVIGPASPVALSVLDLRGLAGVAGAARAARAARETEARRLAVEEARRPFDLSRGPLVRARLLRLDGEDHLLALTMHHSVSDGWSAGVLTDELAALYAAFAAGRPVRLPDLPIQYADFALWQRQWLSGDVLDELLGYWKRQLGGDLAALELPCDRPRPATQTFRGALERRQMPKSLVAGWEALARQRGATPFMVALAAFMALLHRYTGQDDVVIGSAIAGRNRAELEPLIGFFINMLALRADLGGDPTFLELLQRVREVALEAYAHQDLPFEMIVHALRPRRDPSRTPLFQVVLTLHNAAPAAPRFGEVRVEHDLADIGAARFDLSLNLTPAPDGMTAEAEYSTDLFDAATIARLLRHYENIIRAAVAAPDRRLSELALTDDAERYRMLVEWNDTARPFACRCAHELFEEQAARAPDAVALDFEGQLQVTYGELNRRANQLAHYLRRLGVGPETLVGVLADRSPEMVVAVMGVLKAGGAYLPMEPSYPRERLQFMLDDAGVAVVLTQQGLAGLLDGMGARAVCLDSDWDEVAREGEDDPPPVAAPSNLAYVIYTSGSTGRPKGVLIEHRAVANFISSTRSIFEVTPRDRVLQFASLCFDVSVFEIFTALLSGAILVLAGRETLLSPPALTQLMRERGVTITDLPPAMMTLLPSEEFASQRIVFVGGEPFSGELVNRWALPGRRFFNGYGPTESTVTMTLKECTGSWTSSPPIGRPMPNHQVYILDRYLTPVPIGVPGEMYIGGAGLARGYLGRPELTAVTFTPDPFGADPGARLFRTGDLARYLPNGDVDFLGRVDRQVKIRGFRVELGEVEAALARQPGIRQAVAVVREDAPGARRLVAYLLTEDAGAPRLVPEVRASLQRQLPGYMVPAAFVVLDAFPMTASGKVDLRALPPPSDDRPELGEDFVAPRSPIEQVLADRVFAPVLGLKRVGVDDNFFELGGNSLQATQAISRVRSLLQVEVPLRAMFESPTVAGLARAIAEAAPASAAEAKVRDLLAQVERLSEGEARRLLAAKVRERGERRHEQ